MAIATLDETRCHPQECREGICLARKNCPVKAIFQDEPYEVPFLSGGMCNGCAKCLAACPLKAISLH